MACYFNEEYKRFGSLIDPQEVDKKNNEGGRCWTPYLSYAYLIVEMCKFLPESQVWGLKQPHFHTVVYQQK